MAEQYESKLHKEQLDVRTDHDWSMQERTSEGRRVTLSWHGDFVISPTGDTMISKHERFPVAPDGSEAHWMMRREYPHVYLYRYQQPLELGNGTSVSDDGNLD